jgi:hypothetical protein
MNKLILITIILLFCGCTQLIETPENFSLNYSVSSGELGGGKTNYFIHNNVFVFENNSFKLTDAQLIELIQIIKQNNFFGLEEDLSLAPEECVNGPGYELEISLNEQTHKVIGYCIQDEKFLKIGRKIYDLSNELQGITYPLSTGGGTTTQVEEGEPVDLFSCSVDADCAPCSNSECSNINFTEIANCPGNRCGTYIKECKCINNKCTAITGNSFEDQRAEIPKSC